MDTDRVIQLLEEIRAPQRQQVEGQQLALRNQEEAIRAQQEAMARGRVARGRVQRLAVAALALSR